QHAVVSAMLPPGAETFEALGAAARVQQMAGALETCLHLSTAYARERVAFGRPIAKFQAVQQALARLGGEVAAALTAAASAADTFAEHAFGGDVTEGDLFLEIAAAKIRAGEAAGEGAAIAHQAHGAIGFTLDYQLQRFTRQLWGWRDDFGAESHWALRLGQRACAEGADALWPALTRR
ncbi:MAG: acyl-CoA dehydrogenase family protein, partial [Pseudomonadota bacterium]